MKAYTDLEQSHKLAEILPLESADHHYVRKTCDFMGNSVDGNFSSYETLPAWSLAALLSVLPFHLIVDNQRYGFSMIKGLDKNGETYAIEYAIFNTTVYLHLTDFYNNPVDACYEMIIKLNELKML